ncbi:MAG TPA: hypothetical protein VMI75_29690 [Polyangiaceae bacterium]|nr:hypothetical protein [Polyangiaceae bacterium]
MRTLIAVALAFGSSSALAFAAYGCSSSSSGAPTGPCQGPGCQDSGGQQDTGTQQDTGSASDAGMTGDAIGDGPHNAPTPDAMYGGCARQGSFGSPCSATTTGPDTTDCTDPNYTECFVGGQGSWCTKTCTTATDCTMGVEDAGCIPIACNAKGYCK